MTENILIAHILLSDAGFAIWEFLHFSDHQRLGCVCRGTHEHSRKPNVSSVAGWLREWEVLRSLGENIHSRHDDHGDGMATAAEERLRLARKMLPYIRSGTYKVEYVSTDFGHPITFDTLQKAFRDMTKSYHANDRFSFSKGWRKEDYSMCKRDRDRIYADLRQRGGDSENEDEEEDGNARGGDQGNDDAGSNNQQFRCISQFCTADNESIQNIYFVNERDPRRSYCGACLDRDFFLALRFCARHWTCEDYEWDWRKCGNYDGQYGIARHDEKHNEKAQPMCYAVRLWAQEEEEEDDTRSNKLYFVGMNQ